MTKGSANIEVSALPKDQLFWVTFQDSFGEYKHGPCRVNKNGVLVFAGSSGKENIPLRTNIKILGYTIIKGEDENARGNREI